MTEKWVGNPEIEIFREYLRIASVHPDPNYEPCVEFLRRQADEIGLEFRIFYPVNEKNPVVVLTLQGQDAALESILLNSHMDVVPVYEAEWTHPPFGAEIDAEGRIFARGTQDMKSVGMQYLGAIRALKRSGQIFRRTIHVCFVPDEEVGGHLGMREFVKTDAFRQLNVAFSLDEGVASATEEFILFFAEKSTWQVTFKCTGTPAHGAAVVENSAGDKVFAIMEKMMAFRRRELQRMQEHASPITMWSSATTVNLTKLSGGVQINVVPAMLSISYDMRLSIDMDHDAFFAELQQWCTEAGGGIEMEFERKDHKSPATKLNEENPFWVAFKEATDEMGLQIQPIVCPGATDSCFLRDVGVAAIGFSPMNNTPALPHSHDEFIYADGYLRGIEIYKKILPKVANC
ncbi:aminoacylase-1-like [Lutzomyia longipalpis]|uniref:aminoacylase-1-like n=1 Tax=Lutzomyia longipalpis TaxID=7200 RepID=UPI00248383B5|nr:aminoacylase-1-like [Lutzomyia longipalpis]